MSAPIVQFVGLRLNMYLLTVCDAYEPIKELNYSMDVRHTAVANNVTLYQIKRLLNENYVRMYNGGALTNLVNRIISS